MHLTLKHPKVCVIKGSSTLMCLCMRVPGSPSESHCKACTTGPSTHYGPDESKPQSLKNHLTAISYRFPTPLFFLKEPTTLTSPTGSCKDPNRPKSAGSVTRVANC